MHAPFIRYAIHAPSMRHGLLNRGEDVRIGAASTDIAAHQFADIICGGGMAFAHQSDGGTDLSRRAIATLKRVVLNECLLQWMERAVLRETFDGHYLGAVFHNCQRHARVDALAIDEHGASAALSVVTSFFGAGEIQIYAKEIEQGCPGLNL
jgi:hypothetical protein